ncbi:DUF342 domain-containing protein [Clostridium ljungdahlii]|uniref:RNA-binding protein KhpB N-terminal domain-containing protein n=1 Tax=Clostridium ljungdahlii (strain ATCC 55383 / DSM 13528 / PETC) TaxID=748727 RepID=D8GPU7_CLOLD|nr:flagellar assembly protein A [Clostridium ljungdahlii]ADK14006.1 conserved hypothetical protein [Clostridium ljungdahlii DSM 13528]OAA87497.1 hypothetical protein WX45_03617 [Clostridium ljungdahlii DSM 13528]
MKELFHGTSLEECLESASCKLNMPKDKLQYKIVKKSKLLFRKKVIIEVSFGEEDQSNVNSVTEKEIVKTNEKDGTIKLENGKIIVKDPIEDGKPAVIHRGHNISIFVDGAEVKDKCEVFSKNKIEIVFEEDEPKRQMNIYLSDDRMKAYAEVKYISKNVYKLKDKDESHKVNFEGEIIQSIKPPMYTVNEIKNELSNNKVIYGIMEENLKEVVNGDKKLVVACGKEAVNGEDDFLENKFETSVVLKEDTIGNIDFKSIGTINVVKKGDIIAIKHNGTLGKDGFDVTGKVLKCKPIKQIKIKVGDGCVLKDENTVEASIDGKPSIKSNTYYVHQVHEINGDVDISTGNINFIGDIIIHGNVKEGMKVECGNDLIVEKEVERASLNAKGDISIGQTVVSSQICGGGDSVKKIKAMEHLSKFNKNMEQLVGAVKEIKDYNLLGKSKKDGEIIKILLESKFKKLIKLGINVIADLNVESDDYQEDKIVRFIKTKLIGMGPISIKSYSELNELMKIIEDKIEELKDTRALPVKVVLSYCQDSNIQSSGDIIIKGRGEYISQIDANGSIEFLQEKSVARGGILKAENEIKCKIVGSVAGVSTKLQVESKGGNIWADVAYHNTVFKVENKEIVLDSPSKDVHVYLKEGDIVVDKFVL